MEGTSGFSVAVEDEDSGFREDEGELVGLVETSSEASGPECVDGGTCGVRASSLGREGFKESRVGSVSAGLFEEADRGG